ncbi:Piwi domain-containing protein [Mycena epipterygia]|nr:Piwi domain-containing protein [Mycena epipterygia]
MAGRPVSVLTNSFIIKSLPTREYYQYDIAFNASEELPKPLKRHRLVHALQTTAYPDVFQPLAVYDGGRLLYSSRLIPNGVYRVHGSNQQAPQDALGWYDLKITQTNRAVVPAHVNKLLSQGPGNDETAMATTLLQLLLCQSANMKRPNTGRAYFSPEGKFDLPGIAVEMWRGFFQAVRPTIGRMLVTVDTTVAAMYKSGPLIEVAMVVLDNTREVRRLALRDSNQEDFKKLERYFKKRLITVKTNNKSVTKTIHGFVPGPVGRYEFQLSGTGPPTTVGAHYQTAHNIRLAYPDTIGVVTSGKGAPFKVVIPLELCALQPGQLYKKKLPPPATAEVVRQTAMAPGERLRMIRVGSGAPGSISPIQEYAHSEVMKDAGMAVDPNVITIQARLLKVPALLYNNQKRVDPRDGAWNVLGSKFFHSQSMLRWGVVNFISPQFETSTVDGIANACNMLGMNVNRPPQDAVRRGNGHNVKQAIVDVCHALGGAKDVDILIILLPTKAEEIRTRVKYVCDIELGVRSQCLREQKLPRANNQYWNNVALKINARLGGTNVLVDSPVLQEAASKPFMIMGADVAHPGPGTNRPSIASLVWSHDRYGAAYCATTCVQEYSREEIITDLKELVVTAILMFGQKHKTTPASIFFYRDGVSDGEFKQVQEKEIAAINDAFDEIWTKKELKLAKPKLTFIVVGKRHHVTFFPVSANDNVGDKTGNCRAGLVVDKGLAHTQFTDFYLQSHAAIKGTSRSAHYILLQDENFNGNVGKLQELSFALCHIYAKATRSVSIPAPVYYADLACARGKFHIDPASDMDIDASTTSGGKSGKKDTVDIVRWRDAYGVINPNVQGSMYFL